MPTIDPVELAYLAGIFDGEGSINLAIRDRKAKIPRYTMRVTVEMNSRPTVETFQHWFGGKVRVGVLRRGKGHSWSLRCNEVRPFLETIQPRLRIKRRQADLALEYIGKHTFQQHTWNRRPVATEVLADRARFYDLLGQLNDSHWWKKRHLTH